MLLFVVGGVQGGIANYGWYNWNWYRGNEGCALVRGAPPLLGLLCRWAVVGAVFFFECLLATALWDIGVLGHWVIWEFEEEGVIVTSFLREGTELCKRRITLMRIGPSRRHSGTIA